MMKIEGKKLKTNLDRIAAQIKLIDRDNKLLDDMIDFFYSKSSQSDC